MDIKLHDNYVYTRELQLDLEQQKSTANVMYDFIKNQFTPDGKTDLGGNSTLTTKVFRQYNYLLYPSQTLHELYDSIKETFHSCNLHHWDNNVPKETYYIQCWLNFYRKGEFIDWHTHWREQYESWHGFYCVDVEPNSHTTYRIFDRTPGTDDIIIPSKNNLLVMSRSGKDLHRSSEWEMEKPRITVAFDIVPASKLYEGMFKDINHWIPI